MGTGKSSICFLDSFICSCSLVSSFFLLAFLQVLGSHPSLSLLCFSFSHFPSLVPCCSYHQQFLHVLL